MKQSAKDPTFKKYKCPAKWKTDLEAEEDKLSREDCATIIDAFKDWMLNELNGVDSEEGIDFQRAAKFAT